MVTKLARNYKGKDEELPVMAGYLAFSAKRDQLEFEAFSPIFSVDYFNKFDNQIVQTREIIFPLSETIRLKGITSALYASLDKMVEQMTFLSGYIKLAKSNIDANAASFGIPAVKEKAKRRDTEGAIKALRVVNQAVQRNKEALKAVGLKGELIQKLIADEQTLSELNQQQYQVLSARKTLVESNIGLFNDLYSTMQEICRIGKILYGTSKPSKAKEYNLIELFKRVRLITKKKNDEIDSGEAK